MITLGVGLAVAVIIVAIWAVRSQPKKERSSDAGYTPGSTGKDSDAGDGGGDGGNGGD